MKKMTGLVRLQTAIRREEPDVVPHFDGVHQAVRDAILPGASYEDFIDFMDIDAVVFTDRLFAWSYEAVPGQKNVKRDQWGGLVRYTAEETPIPISPAVNSPDELKRYKVPDPDEPWRYKWLEELVRRFKGKRAVIAGCTDIFALGRENFLGDVGYFRGMVKDPAYIDAANEVILDYQLRYLKNCLDLGADMVWVNGDWAMTRGPMVSREFTERFIIPPFKKIIDYCHERGVPCLKHTDGNIWPIFDLIVDAGADGIHPIDPMAGMDIGEAKEKWGDRICLMGNVSCAFTLVTGTSEDVRRDVKECIKKAGKGGGLICMSSNSIHSGVRPENYVAMVKAIREYGKYPLALD